jgi:hypothetical protein
MRTLEETPELLAAARRCVWFKPPSEAIASPVHLIAHILTYGLPQDVHAIRTQLDDDDLTEALESAPPGVFDARSWAYWNWVIRGLRVPPPRPVRTFA